MTPDGIRYSLAAVNCGALGRLGPLTPWSFGGRADPLAGLVMVPIIAKEGLDGIRGKACCDDCGCH